MVMSMTELTIFFASFIGAVWGLMTVMILDKLIPQVIVMTENKCRDCACFHGSTDFCTVKREKVDYLDDICEYFIWD